LSAVQVALNRKNAVTFGFAHGVEAWHVADICDLSGISVCINGMVSLSRLITTFEIPQGVFDAVVAYGGPLSYVFDRAAEALASVRRVLRPGGLFLASVMSLWCARLRRTPVCMSPISPQVRTTQGHSPAGASGGGGRPASGRDPQRRPAPAHVRQRAAPLPHVPRRRAAVRCPPGLDFSLL
jgi:SAM-dependent methyltransferase